MADLPEFRVYISSTIEDLAAERAAAIEVIRRHAVVKDSYRASEDGTVATCTQDVRDAHLYVGIIGQRYGWIPDGENEPDAKSITEFEYDACREPGRPDIPRLIFVRTTNPDKFTDAHTRPSTAQRMKRFRERAGMDQLPYQFASLDDFRIALSEAVMRRRDAFHRERAPGRPIFETRKVWQSALRPIVLFSVPGADDGICLRLVAARQAHIEPAELSPTGDTSLQQQLDKGLQKGQLGCLIVSPASLPRINEPQLAPRFAGVIDTLRRRIGVAPILCIDVDPANLPKEWGVVAAVRIESARLLHSMEAEIESIYMNLRTVAPVSSQPRLALSYLVIAPTQAEVEALAGTNSEVFAGYEEEVRDQRRGQFEQLAKAARSLHTEWPAGMYGTERAHWRCFGKNSLTATQLIKDAVATINAALRGSRERELLQDAEIVLRQYSLDEYLLDQEGSRRVIEAVRDRGCLLLVDEAALLHPQLRVAANVLLAAPRSAIVSVSPCDPSHMPTRRLLHETSFLRVGALVDRFRTEQDPQCELALNSEERVRRWLRMAIPRLLVESDGLASRPRLAGRVEDLLSEPRT